MYRNIQYIYTYNVYLQVFGKALEQPFLVSVKGCAFHWAQAVWRKVQDVGLRAAYHEDSAVYKLIRRVLSLPFLPAEHIQVAYDAPMCSCGRCNR